jgi:hypothetical protein
MKAELLSFHIADNGRFADSGFKQAVKDCNQKITYCAVGAHHQNGIVEKRMKELTLISWTLLLHAKRHWPYYGTHDVAICTQQGSILVELTLTVIRWSEL